MQWSCTGSSTIMSESTPSPGLLNVSSVSSAAPGAVCTKRHLRSSCTTTASALPEASLYASTTCARASDRQVLVVRFGLQPGYISKHAVLNRQIVRTSNRHWWSNLPTIKVQADSTSQTHLMYDLYCIYKYCYLTCVPVITFGGCGASINFKMRCSVAYNPPPSIRFSSVGSDQIDRCTRSV